MAAQSSSRSAKGGAGGGSNATASSRNGGGGNGGGSRHGGGGTGTTGGGSKSSGDANAMQQQPKFLLARGYTSRFLPPSGALKALAADEVEKDLRHFQAYHRAVITYRQQYYLAANPNHAAAAAAAQASAAASSSSLLMSPSSAGASPAAQQNGAAGLASQQPYLLHGVGPAVAALPVRIDPEEEKRLALLRRKIARAEWMREDLEQRYVSLRAHYVQCSQEVKRVQQQIAGRQDFLRACVKDRAATLGLMRARLQMTRDVLASLQRRGHVLAAANADPSMALAPPPTPAASGSAADPANSSKDPLLLDSLWNQVEEEVKKQQRKLGNPRTAKPVPWPCARMPPTPFDVPLLLSNASNAPEKTVAFSGNGVFGSGKKASLVWTLPETVPIDEDGVVDATKVGAGAAAAVISHRRHELDELGEEVAFLQSELEKERVQNQQIAEQIARARSKNDEWVAMICLVRQETESVLHRHNVVLESDLAREASERWFAQDQDDKRQRLHDSSSLASAAASASAAAPASTEPVAPGDPDAAEAALLGVREVEVPMASAGEGGGGPGDEDNDGDDEGSEEEDQQGRAMNEEEDEDGEVAEDTGGKAEASLSKSNSSSSNNKRGANDGEGAEVEDARKKRRKL
jgi:hypothetical protein